MRQLKKELWPQRVSLKQCDADSIHVWLGERMGAFKGRWNVVYNHSKTDYYFRNEQDSLLFTLRWGCDATT